MQSKILSAVVASSLLLAGCGKTLDFRNADISNGKIYESGANTGFSGKVTNVPYAKLPVGPVGQLIQIEAKLTGDNMLSNSIIALGFAAMSGNDGGLLCDIKVADGEVDGKAFCKAGGAKANLFEIEFSHNSVQGHTVIYNPNVDGAKLAEADYKDGKLDGDLKVYGPDGKIIINNAHMKEGVAQGEQEVRDAKTGKLTHRFTTVDGKLKGKEEIWAPDGTKLSEIDWDNGKNGYEKRISLVDNHVLADLVWKDGKETGFVTEGDLRTGYDEYHMKDGVRDGEHRAYRSSSFVVKPYLETVDHYVNGKLEGTATGYNSDGAQVSTTVYKDGVQVADADATASATASGGMSIESCVQARIDAFHKESGADAVISSDMVGEWQGQCVSKLKS